MMKTQNKKRGFTIIELVIVVTVIAILSAVLIPTFAGVIKRANLTADQQAVRSINLELEGAEEADLANLESVEAYLAKVGLTINEPVSNDYRFAYAPSLKKVVLVDDANKIVYPKEYANDQVTVEVAEGEEEKVITELNTTDDIALVAMSRGGEVAIPAAGLTLDTGIYLTKNTTITLAGQVSAPADIVGDGVFCVKKGTLTLEGNGTVSGVNATNWNIAVWADGGKVVINDGTYTNMDSTSTDSQLDLIYVKHGGIIEINGGTFQCKTPNWTLNIHDREVGSIVISGGKFWNFNPAELPANLANDNITVAEGYKVEAGTPDADGNIWYEVVKA